jgi:hypothetical protein
MAIKIRCSGSINLSDIRLFKLGHSGSKQADTDTDAVHDRLRVYSRQNDYDENGGNDESSCGAIIPFSRICHS